MQLIFYLAILLGIATAKPGAGVRKSEIQFSSSSSSYKNGELQHEDKDEGFYTKHEDLSRRTNPIVDSQVEQSKYRNPGQFHTQRLQGQDAEQYFNQFLGQNGFKSRGLGGLDGIEGGIGQAGGIEEVDQHIGTGMHGESTDLRSVSQSSLHGANTGPSYTQTPGKYSKQSSYSYSQSWKSGSEQIPSTTVVRRPVTVLTPITTGDAVEHSQHRSQSSTSQQSYQHRPNYGTTHIVQTVPDSSEDDQYEEQIHEESVTGRGYVRPSSSTYGSSSRTNTDTATAILPEPQTLTTNAHASKRVESSQSQVRKEYVEPSRTVYTGTIPVSTQKYAQRPLNSGNTFRTYQPITTQTHVSEDEAQVTEQRHESSSRTEQRTVTKPKFTTITTIPVASTQTQRLESSNLQQEYGQRPLNSGHTYRTLHSIPSQSQISGNGAQVTEERHESSRTEQRTISKPSITTTMHVVRPATYPTNEHNAQITTSNQNGYYVQRPSYTTYTNQGHAGGTQTIPAYTKSERKESRYVETTSGANRPTTVYYPSSTVVDENLGNFKSMGSSSSSYGTGTRYVSPIVGSSSSGYQYSSSGYTSPTSGLRTYQTFTQPVQSYQTQHYYKSSSSHGGHSHTDDVGVDDCDMQGDDPSLLVESNVDLSQQYEKFGKYGFGQTYDNNENKRFQRGYGYGQRRQYGQYNQPNQQQYESNKFVTGEQHHDQLTQQTQYFGYGEATARPVHLTQQAQDHTFGGQEHEDLTQQTQDHGYGGQEHEDLTQQVQDGFGKLEFGGQQHEDLTQQTQDGFEKLEFGSQHEDLTQQHQTGKLELGEQQHADIVQQHEFDGQQHEDLTQQTQDGFGKFEFGSQQEDLTRQHQTGKLEFGGQQHEDIAQQHENDGQQHEDLTQQTQNGFGKLEFGSQHEDLTQQKQDKIGKLHVGEQQHEEFTQHDLDGQQHEDLTQQVQDGFGKIEVGGHKQTIEHSELEYGGQIQEKDSAQQKQEVLEVTTPKSYQTTTGKIRGSQLTHIQIEKFTQQTQHVDKQKIITQETHLLTNDGNKQDKIMNIEHTQKVEKEQHKFEHTSSDKQKITFESHGITPKTPLAWENLNFGEQEHEDLTQQTQDGFGNLEFGGQQHEELTPHSQLHGKEHAGITQQSQDGFGKLEIGVQNNKDLTQQQHQEKIGKLELSGQEHEDLTQQHQDKIGKLELAGQEHEDLTQQTQDGFGKIEFGGQEYEDLTQQQGQIGNLELGGQEHEDLTQQTQDGFGKLEFSGQQHEDLSQQHQNKTGKLEFGGQEHEDLTQQTQDGFGKLEFGEQHEDFTQQEHQDKIEKIGQLEIDGQQHEDLTQQHQDGFGKLELGGQQEDLTQQTQDNFGHLEGDGQQTMDETQTEMDSYTLRLQQYNRQQQQISGGQGNSPYVIGGGHYASYPNMYQHAGSGSQTQQSVTPQQGHRYGAPPQTYGYGRGATQKEDTSKEDNSSEEKEHRTKKDSTESKESKEDEVTSTTTTTTTEKPGFWKRVGGKIKYSYDSAKESAKQLAEKVQTSVG